MIAGRFSACSLRILSGFSKFHNNQFYFLSRVVFPLPFLLALLCSSPVAWSQASSASPELIRGVVIRSHGPAVVNINVELRDLRGLRFGSAATNAEGAFAIAAPRELGEYVLLASDGPTLVGQRFSWQGRQPEFRITLPDLASNSGAKTAENTVSANRLGTTERTRKYIQQAHKAFAESRTEDAMGDLNLALGENPRCAAALTMRALVKLSTKDLDGALDDATHAAALDPDREESYIAMATALNALGQFKKGGEVSAQALMLDIDSWQARLELAKSLYGQNQFVLALHELDFLDNDFPDIHLLRGNVLIQLERREKAVEEFEHFLQEAPHDPRSSKVSQIVAGSKAEH